jgi:O-antigen/teichoic acid export membrane protein
MSVYVSKLEKLFIYLKKVMTLVRLQSFDVSSIEGRSMERYRRIAVNTLSSVAAKGVTALTMLASVNITLNYLGRERFGLFATLTSLMSFLILTDLGIGNALVNAVAKTDGHDDRAGTASAVSSAFFLLSLQAMVILASMCAVYQFVDWAWLFGAEGSTARSEAGPAFAILIVVVVCQLPLCIVNRVQEGYQESSKNNLWQLIGNLLGLISLLICVRIGLGVPWLVFALAGVPLLSTILNAWLFFGFKRPWLVPRWSCVSCAVVKDLIHAGGMFLALSTLAFIGIYSDNLVISHILGSAAVSEYTIMQRLSLIAFLYQAFILTLWPAYGEAMARGEYCWVRRAFSRALLISSCLGFAIAVLLILAGPSLIRLWLGSQVEIPTALLYGFCAYIFISAPIGCIATVFNSGPLLRNQVAILSIAAAVAIALKIALVSKYGVSGVIWATVLAFSLFYVLPGLYIVYRLLWRRVSLQNYI